MGDIVKPRRTAPDRDPGPSNAKGMASRGKAPRTARGQATMDRILNAAIEEFGSRGFADTSIVSITGRAGVALGTFYTYFDSKEALFAALVRHMSDSVKVHVAPRMEGAADTLDGERRALAAYLDFVARRSAVYRIIDEAEFVDPDGYRQHYETTVARIRARLEAGEARGDLSPAHPLEREVRAWAIMGMNVFLGLRFGVWDKADGEAVADAVSAMLRDGIARRD